MVLGLGANLLPCVPAHEGVLILPGSSLEGKVGKIPSVYNSNGEAHGLKAWPTREILGNEITLWSKSGLYNLCVRTGSVSGVFAIDCDVADSELNDAIADTIYQVLGFELPFRTRSNRPLFLCPFRMEGSFKKRIIETAHGRIEFLADGQQFVAAGTHKSGVRIEWAGGLPQDIPTLTQAQFEALWALLKEKFSLPETVGKVTAADSSPPASDESQAILTTLSDADWQDLIQALKVLQPKVIDNDLWSEVGYGLLSLKSTRPVDRLWYEFSRGAAGYTEGAPEAWWSAHSSQTPHSDYRHIFTLARREGWAKTSGPNTFSPVEESAGPAPETLPDLPTKPTIRISGGSLPEILSSCSKLLSPDLYANGGTLVKIGAAELLEDGVRRDPNQPVFLRRITTEWARVRLTELATFMKYDRRMEEWRVVDCPKDLAIAFMDQPEWPAFRPLDAIVSSPFVREDGSICDTPGYDRASHAIYNPNADFPQLRDAPTQTDAMAALGRILEPFNQFPYATGAARSAFVAHILTEVARLAVDRCPIFWYTAPSAGTGKSLLSEMAATIAHGHEPALRPWPKAEDEVRKTLFASLLAGDRSITFDNVSKGFKMRSSELCAFLTAAWWKDRKLGVSEAMAVRNRSVVTMSGNNITPVADMARRSLVIRLDANTADLKSRTFAIKNLRAHVLANRVDLLIAALTIIRAYKLSGEISEQAPLPSFEQWSATVRDPLIWLGMEDPAGSQAEETDDEEEATDIAFSALAPSFAIGKFTANDISRVAATNDDLNASLLAAGCSEPYSATKVGYWLRDNRDKICGSWKLIRGTKGKDGIKWMFKKIGNGDLV